MTINSEMVAVLREMVAVGGHDYSCPVSAHNRFAMQAGIGRVRRGRGANTEAAAVARAFREAAEYELQRPACKCVLGRAIALLEKVDQS